MQIRLRSRAKNLSQNLYRRTDGTEQEGRHIFWLSFPFPRSPYADKASLTSEKPISKSIPPHRRYGARGAAHRICNSFGVDDIQGIRLDDMQHWGLMIYSLRLMICNSCGIDKSALASDLASRTSYKKRIRDIPYSYARTGIRG